MGKKVVFSVCIMAVWLAYLVILTPSIKADVTLYTNCSGGVYTELIYNNDSVTFNNTFICPGNGQCAYNGLECDGPAPAEAYFPLAIVFSLITFTFAYLAFRVGEYHWPLQYMFLFFTVAFIAFDIYMVGGFAMLTINGLYDIIIGAYTLGVMTILGIVTYFVGLIVKGILEGLATKKKLGRPFKW